MDHIVAVGNRGGNNDENLQTVCHNCHVDKTKRDMFLMRCLSIEEWQQHAETHRAIMTIFREFHNQLYEDFGSSHKIYAKARDIERALQTIKSLLDDEFFFQHSEFEQGIFYGFEKDSRETLLLTKKLMPRRDWGRVEA